MKGNRLRAALLAALMALWMPLSCKASITVMDSGDRYKSRPDHFYGRAFHRGYEYMARMQHIAENLSLCPSPFGPGPERVNLTVVPPDKSPVALLASNMGCPLDEKVKFVTEMIYPKGVVKYLVVDGDRSLRSLKEGEEVGFMKDGEEERVQSDSAVPYPSLQAMFGLGPESFQVDTGSSFFTDGASLTLGVMHVSSHTYFKLLATIQNQKKEVGEAGGPRVILDGGWRVGNRQVIVWMAVSALLSACACTFLLVVHNGSVLWFQQEEEAPQQPQRERRRRLTREQVRRMLPPFVFDGTALHPYHSSSHPRPAPQTTTEDGPSSQGLLAADETPWVPEAVELCCCSICLDDYEAGDKLRVLPCNHAFHYRCIGRWLAERSATCPLCKTELWEEESQDEEEDEDIAPDAGPSTMSWRQFIDMMSFTPEAGHENLVTSNVGQQHQGGEDLSPEPSWWRRRWILHRRGRLSVEEQGMALNSLSEPLLQAENGQVDSAEERAVEPRPDPPQTGSPERE